MATLLRVIVTGHFLWPEGAPIPRVGETIRGENPKGEAARLRVTGVEYNPREQTRGDWIIQVDIATKLIPKPSRG